MIKILIIILQLLLLKNNILIIPVVLLSFILISFNNSCKAGVIFVQLFKFHKPWETLYINIYIWFIINI